MKVFNRLLFILTITICVCCNSDEDDSVEPTESDSTLQDISDWTDATHGNDASPDYSTVFPQDKVSTIEITMTKENWESINDNMEEISGTTFGGGGGTMGGGNGGIPGGGGGAGGGFSSEDPDYVAVQFKFNDREWYKVGFRLKGNSTLSSAWGSGIYKLPFRLNFDEFEDQYPQIENQRFYGFKELSMSPGIQDNSLIREKVAADIFRTAGIPAARTSFYKVYINFGEGVKYCGVYTMVEVIDDTMVKDQFGEDEGNIYKPESNFSSFSEAQFEKKNNKSENDYSDVQTAITALNSSLRTTDPEEWRKNLEAAFNVDHFIKWLAVNSTLVNWDTYGGAMAHNYYLYHHSTKGLTWIPWDNNESLSLGRMGDAGDLSQSNVTNSWPLIRYLIDDAVYNQKYKDYIKDFSENTFTTEKMNALFEYNHNLISPYVIGPDEKEEGKYTNLSSASAFTSALSDLKDHVVSRLKAVQDYLN